MKKWKLSKPLQGILALLLTALIGYAVRSGLKATWRKIMKKEPPDKPSRQGVSWRETAIWTALSGLAGAITNQIVKTATRKLSGAG